MNGGMNDTIVANMQRYADRIREQIDEVKSYALVPNEAGGSQGYNWAILSSFESEADIDTYKVAPLHREFVEYCDPYTEDFLTLDYHAAGGE